MSEGLFVSLAGLVVGGLLMGEALDQNHKKNFRAAGFFACAALIALTWGRL